MDIAGISKEGLEISRKNHALFIPSLAVMFIMFVLTSVVVGGRMSTPDAASSSLGALMGGAFLVSMVGGFLGLFAHGMTVAMAQEALDTGKTTINTGTDMVKARFIPLLISALFVGIIVMIGSMLLVIPGLVAAFLLMFTFIIVVTGNSGAVDAMKGSFQLVKSRIGDSAVLFIALFVAGIAAGIANMLLNVIPIIGPILGMALMGIFSGYISVVMVIAYRRLKEQELKPLI